MKKILWILAAASLTLAQTASESDTVPANARRKILALARQLTRYTCLQTINREYFVVDSSRIRGKLLTAPEPRRTCSATLDQPANDLTLGNIYRAGDRIPLTLFSGNPELEVALIFRA